MKKYSLKKTLVALSLASAMTFNLAGCTVSGGSNVSESSSQTQMIDDNYCQENYFFVYLNNKMYFTTRELNSAGDYFDYYDVKTGELVGRMLKPMTDEAHYSNFAIYHDAIYNDGKYFDGEYGYGKIVPKCALIPVNSIMPGNTFTQEEFDFFATTSDELTRKIQECISFSSYTVEDCTAVWKSLITDFEVDSHTVETATLRRYDCVTKDDKKSTFIAYQCSYNEKDSGFHYIYDILTGNIYYIGEGLENDFESISAFDYDNYENKTVAELVDEFGTSKKEEEPELSGEDQIVFSAQDLYVLNSRANSVITVTEGAKRYYFLLKTGEKLLEEPHDDIYKDIYNETAEVWMDENAIGGGYFNPGHDELVSFVVSEFSGEEPAVLPINKFLASNGLEEFISADGKYSLADIDKIIEAIKVDESVKEYRYK